MKIELIFKKEAKIENALNNCVIIDNVRTVYFFNYENYGASIGILTQTNELFIHLVDDIKFVKME
jgi:hypothetical protein